MNGGAKQIYRLLFIVALSLASVATGQQEIQDQIASLRVDIEQAQQHVRDLAAQQKSLEREAAQAQEQIARLQEQEAQQLSQLTDLQSRRSDLDRQISALQTQHDNLADLMRKRVRMLYVSYQRPVIESVLQAGRAGDMMRTAVYLGKVRAADAQAMQQLLHSATDLELSKGKLHEVMQQQRSAKDKLVAQRAVLKNSIEAKQKLSQRLKAQQAEYQEGLLRLKAQSLRLESVLSSLMPGEGGGETLGRRSGAASDSPIEGFGGMGLFASGLDLSLPVEGSVVTPFGKRLVGAMDPTSVTKGVDIAAPVDAPIRAIAAGRVMFVGELPQLGKIVVIDHGLRSYSLYGRVAKLAVSRGEDVRGGQELARTADLGENGANFYFEVRNAGTAVNPQPFLGAAHPK